MVVGGLAGATCVHDQVATAEARAARVAPKGEPMAVPQAV